MTKIPKFNLQDESIKFFFEPSFHPPFVPRCKPTHSPANNRSNTPFIFISCLEEYHTPPLPLYHYFILTTPNKLPCLCLALAQPHPSLPCISFILTYNIQFFEGSNNPLPIKTQQLDYPRLHIHETDQTFGVSTWSIFPSIIE